MWQLHLLGFLCARAESPPVRWGGTQPADEPAVARLWPPRQAFREDGGEIAGHLRSFSAGRCRLLPGRTAGRSPRRPTPASSRRPARGPRTRGRSRPRTGPSGSPGSRSRRPPVKNLSVKSLHPRGPVQKGSKPEGLEPRAPWHPLDVWPVTDKEAQGLGWSCGQWVPVGPLHLA